MHSSRMLLIANLAVISNLITFETANANVTQYIIQPGYDRLIPPKVSIDEPVLVNVSMFVLNVRSVKPKDLSFTTDLFIHQQWLDDRLVFPVDVINEDDISLHGSWRDKLWIPDMFFKNGIYGDLTTDAFRTTYFKLYRNNTVLMVSRVSVDLVCEMDFAKYPHDVHYCNISLMSLSNRNESVVMRWKQFKLSKRLFNSDFDIVLLSTNICDQSYEIGNFSCISSTFSLQRNLGNFVTRKYIPSFTIVITAFVSFWIPISSYPARVSLVVTSLLALITQQLQTTSDISTSYFVCINIWMNVCTTLVFFCLIEFAFAMMWEQKKKKRAASRMNSVNVNTIEFGAETRLKRVFEKFEKNDRNAVDELSKIFFPSLFLLNSVFYYLYVQYS